MPRKSIIDKKFIKIESVRKDKNANKRVVFNYLLKNKEKPITQKEISKITNVHPSAVSRIITELKAEKISYGKRKYKIIEVDGKYTVSDSEDFIKANESKHTKYEISAPKIWLDKSAEKINNYVVLFKINSRFSKKVEQVLKSEFDDIKLIIRDKQNMYIILKDTKDVDRLEETRKKLFALYEENVILDKENKKNRIAKKDKSSGT